MTKNKKEIEELTARATVLQKELAEIIYNLEIQSYCRGYHNKIIEYNRQQIQTIMKNIKTLEKRRENLTKSIDKIIKELEGKK